MSDIRIVMNLGQHSEAAAQRPWNGLPRPSQPTVLCAIYTPAAISCWGRLTVRLLTGHSTHGAYPQHWPDLTPAWLCLLVGEGWERAVSLLNLVSQKGATSSAGRRADLITGAASLPALSPRPSHWSHPAHWALIYLPHSPRPSVGESVQWLPCLMLVLKVNIPRRPKQTSQMKRSQNKTPACTQPGTAVHARGWTQAPPAPEQVLGTVLQAGGWGPCPAQKAKEQQGHTGS